MDAYVLEDDTEDVDDSVALEYDKDLFRVIFLTVNVDDIISIFQEIISDFLRNYLSSFSPNIWDVVSCEESWRGLTWSEHGVTETKVAM